ncbi:hypothetical protein SAMN06264365_11093 [Actinoplanes regularis]|uniref:Uncharacterized protein n=1 Tax=Actinoplanes regularis TaxID=52697 RepID=A0A239BRB9_9ACTN|nr:hypothetical protein Are01nite_48030 [Actinoplanes regularis]SNS10567.1 hypothetical protein SAMN06264365_11093 [Actinoplanes regularis]
MLLTEAGHGPRPRVGRIVSGRLVLRFDPVDSLPGGRDIPVAVGLGGPVPGVLVDGSVNGLRLTEARWISEVLGTGLPDGAAGSSEVPSISW